MSNERYESTLTQEEDLGKAWKRAFVKELNSTEKFFTIHARAPSVVGFSEEHGAWIIKTNNRGNKHRLVRNILFKEKKIYIEKVERHSATDSSSVGFS